MTSAGLYIHIPFCQNICNYCDFFTTENRDAEIPQFVEMLIREIALTAMEHSHHWQIDSIYLGGGSPALVLPKDLEIILNNLRKHFSFTSSSEITIEINPGENSLDNLKTFKEMGINRLSIGFQSLDSELLTLLTRRHNQDDCFTLYKNAREAGFENISIDMLYNIPGQTVAGLMNTLKTVVEMQPEHIALYSLTAEKGTPFYADIQNGYLSFPSEAAENEMYREGSSYLRDCRFTHYEVSHFATPDKESVHNLHYWQRDRYLAFGPSAHGFDGEKRWWNVSSLDKYFELLSQNKLPIQESEFLTDENIANEIIMNGLQTNLGIPILYFDNIDDKYIKKWDSYLERENGLIILKPEFYQFADEIATDLMVGKQLTTDDHGKTQKIKNCHS